MNDELHFNLLKIIDLASLSLFFFFCEHCVRAKAALTANVMRAVDQSVGETRSSSAKQEEIKRKKVVELFSSFIALDNETSENSVLRVHPTRHALSVRLEGSEFSFDM